MLFIDNGLLKVESSVLYSFQSFSFGEKKSRGQIRPREILVKFLGEIWEIVSQK